MKTKYKLALLIFLSTLALLSVILFFCYGDIAVLNPKGMIADKESALITISFLLMLIVVIPVFILTLCIAWKYRASNKKAKYTPDWDHNHILESIWWGVPCVIIIILGVITWIRTHELDPFQPIASNVKPIRIQAVALQWKWLFIYPEQKIATVNFVQFPEKTPLNFEITSDAPMNSLWIPQLGGQMYAMTGMKSKLHLMASETGSFEGSSANLSGKGFAGMRFIAKATTQAEFEDWVASVKQSPNSLGLDVYNKLAEPSENNPEAFYALEQEDLYDQIIMKYMMPPQMQGMEHGK